MPRGRPCKYGERNVSSGKCPPKPKPIQTKKRGRPCKYGERVASGKCPPKPRQTKKSNSIDSETPSTIDVEFILYNNNKQVSDIHMRDMDIIENYLISMLEINPNYISYGDDAKFIINNVPYYKNSKKIGSGEEKYTVNRKISDNLLQKRLKQGELGDSWGKVTFKYKTF